MKTCLLIFASVLMAELGDKTQLATVFFATDSTVFSLGHQRRMLPVGHVIVDWQFMLAAC
jgi:putative Ca2+/H+ antiporter (TMEM165/GDT1 family)